MQRLLTSEAAPAPVAALARRSTEAGGPPVKGRVGRQLIQLLRWKSDEPINIGGLTLARALDFFNRPDPDPDAGGVIFEDEPAERTALGDRVRALAPVAFAALRANQVSAGDLLVLAQRNVQVRGADQQLLIDFIAAMARQGVVLGFTEWLANVDANPNADNRQDHMNELWEAARQLLMNHVASLDLSERAIPGTAAGQTADLTLAGGAQVEVKTVRAPIMRGNDLRAQLEAGLAKFDGATSAENGVTVFASVDAALFGGGRTTRRKNLNTTVTVDPATVRITSTRSRADNNAAIGAPEVDDVVAYVQGLLDGGAAAGTARVRRVSVIMENTRSFELTRQANGTWAAAWL